MSAEKFLEEAEVMKKLHHPHLVALLAVCTKEQPIYIITELIGGGSLLDYLKKNKNLPTDQLINMASQVHDLRGLGLLPLVFLIFFTCYL